MTLPPLVRTALLLDLDGTLLDIAPTPDGVMVPPGLTETLRGLPHRLDGALAIVTGRPIEIVDSLLDDAVPAVAGEHGGAMRPARDAPVERPFLKPPPEAWLTRAAALAANHPGVLLERKARGFGLHFRLAPEAGPAIHADLTALLAGSADFEVMQGLMLWEVRPRGVDKGHAVTSLMRLPRFHGRLPVFIGDDVTDEDGMRAACAMGGNGLRVQDWFGGPAGVRAWLQTSNAAGEWAPFPRPV